MTSVEDRRMSLDANCREEATYSVKLGGTTAGKSRQGAAVKEFFVCENHGQLLTQVDGELPEEGWSPSLAGRPQPLA
ncbi:MAG: hypothetical protein L3K09_04270 [Thermoplasmata archaeon]|nr:hypothetical protein [Thermoplasmata archaeon]